jgi:HSP20 family molecular chaperone IbpA
MGAAADATNGLALPPILSLKGLPLNRQAGLPICSRSNRKRRDAVRVLGEVPKGLRMSRSPPLSSPYLLGFDDIERALDKVTKAASDGYPPYNIERLARTPDAPERLRITLAIAGFTRDQLDITLDHNQLVIRGRQCDDKDRQFLHRGIAARQFQRSFLLAEGMEVLGADLSNGLLLIDLARPRTERIVKTIKITALD